MGRSDGQTVNGSRVERGHLEIYERLALLNQHCMAVAEVLALLRDQGALAKRESTYFRLMIEEVRASSSQTIMERMDEHEVQAAAGVSKRRMVLEKRLFES